MNTEQQQIERKDQEIAALRQQIDSLQQQLLFHGIRPRGWRAAHEPSDEQCDKLLAIVAQRFNILTPRYDDSPRAQSLEQQQVDYRKQFFEALRWLQQARRSDDAKLATNYAVSFWTDAAEQFARIRISTLAFVSAVVASGDTAYSLDAKEWPFGLNFGLSLGSRAEHADKAAGWRRVLATGQVIEPTPLPNMGRISQPQELVLFGGGVRGRSFAG